MVKIIPVGRDLSARVDDDVYEMLARYRWYPHRNGNTIYARARVPGRDTHWTAMHRLILGAPTGLHVDHINGCGLDNRRDNLRLATDAQNLANRRKNRNSASRYKGVYIQKPGVVWRALIQGPEGRKHLGYFRSEEDAARAYDKAALARWGEFARLNFPAAE